MFELKDPAINVKEIIESSFYIVDKKRNKIPFLLNPIQSKFYENQTHFDLVLKSRKVGMSSLILAEWLCACLLEDNTRAVVISHESDATKRLLDRVYYYIDNLVIKPKLDTASRNEIKFTETNSSFWIGTAGSKAFGRGDDISKLLLSEYDWYENTSVIDGVLAACVPDAHRVVETTANGFGSQFHQLWNKGY